MCVCMCVCVRACVCGVFPPSGEKPRRMPSYSFFKQKTAYEISECDWSSDVCSSD
eukprot:COSAG06_NODE_35809_length_455_cov_0.977528_1_plen_54_part_01